MIEPNGKSIDIFGDNDAGKTTIYDAFLWCLFNKDSKERTKIQWRPLDENSEPIRGKQTSVTVVLTINGQAKEFEKPSEETKRLSNEIRNTSLMRCLQNTS